MRKMFSQKQIEKIAEEYAGGLPDIKSGDAGKALVVNQAETGATWSQIGLSPEDQEKLDNSLQLPESAPAAQQLVGINTSGEQNALTIGDGLELNNNVLSAPIEIITLNFNHSSELSISNELHNKLYIDESAKEIVINIVNPGNSHQAGLYMHNSKGADYWQVTDDTSSSTSSTNKKYFGFIYMTVLPTYKITKSGSSGSYKLTLANNADHNSIQKVDPNYDGMPEFNYNSSPTGTKTLPNQMGYWWKTFIPIIKVTLTGNDFEYVVVHAKYTTILSNVYTYYYEGTDGTSKYLLQWNQDGTYTITVTAL